MAIDLTLTSVIYNPWSASGGEALSGTGSDLLEVNYSSLGFVASTSDSYKSTAGDIFKVFIDGTRIYRTSDSLYAGGKNFLETGDVDNSILNGQTSQTWSGSTSDTVWTIDTANQKIILNKTAILATSLYGSGGGAAVSFEAGAIIEVRREVQDQSSPAVDFSNSSILTEQDLDNSSANVFHMAQQAIETAGNALEYDTGSGTYKAYQPGTTTRKKITQVADGVADNDAVNIGQLEVHDTTITGYRDTTLAYKEDTEDYKLEAGDWAQKADGQVKVYTDNARTGGDLGHSAKAHASVVGTHAPSTGSAKEWATTTGEAVDTTYSSKEYAQGSTLAAGGSAKNWAQLATTPTTTAEDASAKEWAVGVSSHKANGSAKQWALGGGSFVEATEVTSGLYSARKYASNSAASASAAATSAANAATSYDSFDDRYLGVFTSDPTQDNDGDALASGMLYFNSSTNGMKVYDGGNWINATSASTVSMSEYKFVTTSGQVSSRTYTGTADIGGNLSYTASNTLVFLNGVLLKETVPSGATHDYVAQNGTSIILTVAAVLNDELTVVAYKSFTVSDTVSAGSGGTFSGAVTCAAGLIANTADINGGTIDGATITSPVINTGVSGSAILDSDTMSGASATTLSSSESIKAYVDASGIDGVSSTGATASDTITITGNLKVKGAFMQSSTHQAMVLGG